MKMRFKKALWICCSIAALCAVMVLVLFILYPPQYILRAAYNGSSKITDYQFFPSRAIAKSAVPYEYAYALNEEIAKRSIVYSAGGAAQTAPLEALLDANGTTSMIVITNDQVVYEQYFHGYDKDSTETSFSTAKSMDSLMIGMAIADGYIKSEKQAVVDFLPELTGTAFEHLTIENLLMMRSNIRYEEGFAFFTDDAKTYYMPDLRDLALHHLQADRGYTGQFHYNNYHPLLLGIILERSTGEAVSDYFQKKIWDPVGAQFDASWSLDSTETGFEKMESGLNFRSIDFAKIGSMLLHGGKWNGFDIISQDWIKRSTVAPAPMAQSDIDSDFLKGQNVGYQYMWYSIENGKGGHDFFARGQFGQYLYISPENQTVIVRTGYSAGDVAWWPDVFGQVASALGENESARSPAGKTLSRANLAYNALK